ncbi:hypothetical protein KR009_012074, partial [Drosophila setifemur]
QDFNRPLKWRRLHTFWFCFLRFWKHTWCRAALFLTVWCLLTRPSMPELVYRVDPLALLAATLRTYQRAGCDSEQLSLSCPRGTSISIELAQYGRAGDLTDHSLCPPVSQEVLATSGSAGKAVIHSGTGIEGKTPEACTVSGLQYALLQTVVDACQKKRHCKFAANLKSHSSKDPCAGIRKFVEIAYKCRPYEFRSKMACENDNMSLMCNPYSRIAIYSATFGHNERETMQCEQSAAASPDNGAGGPPTCLVSYATETVMQICHGRRRCTVSADAGTFGSPCKADVRMYLKVVYTCIPRKVLKDRYESAPDVDEPQQAEHDLEQDELYDEDQFYKESEAIPPAPKLQSAIPNIRLASDFSDGTAGVGTSSTHLPPVRTRGVTLEEHQDQFYLYLIISVATGVLLCLTLVIGKLTLQKRRGEQKNVGDKTFGHSQNGNAAVNSGSDQFQQTPTCEAPLPESFGDNISDIDTDIDMSCPMALPSLSSKNEDSRANMDHSTVSGTLTMGPNVFGPSGPTTVSSAYGSVMVSGHHHMLRRTLIPTGIGLLGQPPPQPPIMGTGLSLPPHSLSSIPSSSNRSCGVYYDSTVPRNFTRETSTDSSASLPIAIPMRLSPHVTFNMLPLTASIGTSADGCAVSNCGSRRLRIPTSCSKMEIPVITFSASPGSPSVSLPPKWIALQSGKSLEIMEATPDSQSSIEPILCKNDSQKITSSIRNICF